MHALIAGFGLGLGLIVAIGAQNAFILKQDLKRRDRLRDVRDRGQPAARRAGLSAYAAEAACAAPARRRWVLPMAMAAQTAGTASMPRIQLKPSPMPSSAPPKAEPRMLPKRPMPSIQLTPVARAAVG